ncbi:MAG: LD-carboxypeptidase [Proteobacteria bacterium]|nr:MAG: LD-carboxypeptidase [Pseudomonadota bacterium]
MVNAIIIDPSGQPDREALERNVADLVRRGVNLESGGYPPSAGERLRETGVARRALLLADALDNYDVVICARGGYGTSDLLERLDWRRLESLTPRLVVGFSDITALQAALYVRLGWRSLHAPMPGSSLWRAEGDDVSVVVGILHAWPGTCTGALPLACDESFEPVRGRLFGGCVSVLGALIGTPYFPASLRGHIVFLEDVNETAPRVLRSWNQWRQSGILDGVSAVVLGRFTHNDGVECRLLDELPAMIRERSECPVFTSTAFGHVSPNMPIMTGADGVIAAGRLTWSTEPLSSSPGTG